MAIVQRLAEEDGVYLANSMNSLRLEGQKTLSIEIVQQFDWEVPDSIVIPGGNLGNVSALGAGFDLMLDLGVIAQAAAHRRRPGGGRQPALHAPSGTAGRFEPMTAAADDRLGDPDRQPGVGATRRSRTLQRFDGMVEQATESELADAAARADRTGHVQLPAHRRGAGGAREAGRPRRDRARPIG